MQTSVLLRACPHQKVPMKHAILMSEGAVIRGRQHKFTFKLSHGKGINSSSFCLRVFEIKVEDGVAHSRTTN